MTWWEMQPLHNANALHRMPSGYWKIVFVQPTKAADSIWVAPFFFDQDIPKTDKVIDHLSSAKEIERRSGLDCLRELPDDIEERIEGERFSDWAVVHFK